MNSSFNHTTGVKAILVFGLDASNSSIQIQSGLHLDGSLWADLKIHKKLAYLNNKLQIGTDEIIITAQMVKW